MPLWVDIESLMAFTYSGVHAEALRHASDWFVPKTWPPYVLWWVADDHRPDWREAIARFELIHDRGPTADAFNFKSPFDTTGRPTVVDRSASAFSHREFDVTGVQVKVLAPCVSEPKFRAVRETRCHRTCYPTLSSPFDECAVQQGTCLGAFGERGRGALS